MELKENASSDMRGTGTLNSLARGLVVDLPGTCNSMGVKGLGRMIVSPLTEDRVDWAG